MDAIKEALIALFTTGTYIIMTSICSNCIGEFHLKTRINEEGVIGECCECHSDDSPVISLQSLALIVDPVFRMLYGRAEYVPRIGDGGDDKVEYRQEGEELADALQDLISGDLACIDELIAELADTEHHYPGDPDEYFYDESQNFSRLPYFEIGGTWQWDATLEELKHSRRFFSDTAKELFSRLFERIDHLYANTQKRSYPVVRTLPKGTELFRARICRSDGEYKEFLKEPLKHIGPPPNNHARDGRMNARGITVLYCARDLPTCLAEMRPAIGTRLMLIALKTTARLRILDFTRLEKASLPNTRGYFDKGYFEERDRRYLLMRLHTLISQPIAPEREDDYLITQTMAEYLAHVHHRPFDGIAFQSAQRANGINVVLFPAKDRLSNEPAALFDIEYVIGSLASYLTESISYRHAKEHTSDRPFNLDFLDDTSF